MARLRRADCSGPGITRVRRGRGFAYLRRRRRARSTSPTVLARIRELGDPARLARRLDLPARRTATCRRRASTTPGRKQYRYHDAWRTRRDAEKFDDMVALRARAAASCASSVDADLRASRARPASACWPARCGCSTAASSASAPRSTASRTSPTGSRRCARSTYASKTDGDDGLRLPGQERPAARAGASSTRRRCEVVATLKRRRGGGDELLAYKAGRTLARRALRRHQRVPQGTRPATTSRPRTSGPGARPCCAAVALAVSGAGRRRPKTGRKRAITRAVKEIAHYLGNTPAVCRASYIDPRVFDAYRGGLVIDLARAERAARRRGGGARPARRARALADARARRGVAPIRSRAPPGPGPGRRARRAAGAAGRRARAPSGRSGCWAPRGRASGRGHGRRLGDDRLVRRHRGGDFEGRHTVRPTRSRVFATGVACRVVPASQAPGGQRRRQVAVALEPRQGLLSRGRLHQGPGHRVLHARGAGAAAAPARPAADAQALPERRRGRRTSTRSSARRTRRTGCARRRCTPAAGRSTSAWPTTCRRSSGSPTSPTSSCTPRSRSPSDYDSPTVIAFDLDPGRRPRSSSARRSR